MFDLQFGARALRLHQCHRVRAHVLNKADVGRFGGDLRVDGQHPQVVAATRAEHHAVLAPLHRLVVLVVRRVGDVEKDGHGRKQRMPISPCSPMPVRGVPVIAVLAILNSCTIWLSCTSQSLLKTLNASAANDLRQARHAAPPRCGRRHRAQVGRAARAREGQPRRA